MHLSLPRTNINCTHWLYYSVPAQVTACTSTNVDLITLLLLLPMVSQISGCYHNYRSRKAPREFSFQSPLNHPTERVNWQLSLLIALMDKHSQTPQLNCNRKDSQHIICFTYPLVEIWPATQETRHFAPSCRWLSQVSPTGEYSCCCCSHRVRVS